MAVKKAKEVYDWKSTEEKEFDVKTFDVKLYNKILKRGLSGGLGKRKGQMCIEAAICTVLGLEHGDDPRCVTEAVRGFKISLNDENWSSPQARAKGLHDLGLAQLGSKGKIRSETFNEAFLTEAEKELYPAVKKSIPDSCIHLSDSAEDVVELLPTGKKHKDKFLKMAAKVALTVLTRLKSPGVKLFDKKQKKGSKAK